MTNEILYVAFLFFIGACVCVFKRVNDKLYEFFTFFSFLGLSFVVRYSGFDGDIEVYATALSSTSLSLYYLKEPVFWIFSRYVFEFLGSQELVFVFFDTIVFSIILYVRNRLCLPKYFPYLVVLFFPSVMGMQNVYRQFIASGFLLMFFSQVITEEKTRFKLLTFLMAGLCHNAAFVFLPILFLKSKSWKVSALFLVTVVSILILLPIAALSKSSSVTGEVPASMFVVLFSLVVLSYLVVFQFKFKSRPPVYTQFLYFLLFCYVLTIEAWLVLGAAQAKRLGMISLVMCLIPLVMSIDIRFKQKKIISLLFLIVLTVPTLLFKNVFSLLQITDKSFKIEAVSKNHSQKGTH